MNSNNITYKIHPTTTILFWNRNTHYTLLTHFFYDFLWKIAFFFHSLNNWGYFAMGKITNHCLYHLLVICENTCHFIASLSVKKLYIYRLHKHSSIYIRHKTRVCLTYHTYKIPDLPFFRTSQPLHIDEVMDMADICYR